MSIVIVSEAIDLVKRDTVKPSRTVWGVTQLSCNYDATRTRFTKSSSAGIFMTRRVTRGHAFCKGY
ncbi:hypothetical protein K440DRAFT_256470 [Wilcoxina mikolae CBS 423.85]|nr:hypothetical protein K440DRAFT_256470 [Wilcoxina mikolae CBS 423.85]